MPMINGIPTPSALLSSAHNAYGHLSTTITNMTAPLDHEEELWPQFEVSAQSVTDACKKFEESLVVPTRKFIEVAFHTYPITSTFASVFLILVSLPFLSFLGFAVFVLASTIFTGLCAAVVVSALIIGLCGTFLSMLILLLAALSAWISTSLVFGYIAWRLYALVRSDGRAGVSQWSTETKGRFRRQKKEAEERRGRSPESVVLVKEEETSTPPDESTDKTITQ
ncbi:hypothetical protein BJ322DRAFT_1108649 [Thelephora terrestris]|uniref:Uncharacterized protein n=1 Tax=Thelephora terrestris TaxID=56493 RepID=A0A9P6HDZ0_9AGAM|nr:hypothetical protein BJ322DRAFT_1108649 [Thelephora terrestris]